MKRRMLGALFLLILAVLPSGTALARETVRIGFREFYGYSSRDESGERVGYMTEWFRRLALRLDWNLEWVDLAYGDSAEALAAGTIDVSPFVMSPELEHVAYEYTRVPVGFFRMALFVPRDSVFDAYSVEKMNGVIVGVMSDNSMRDRLTAALADNGVSCSFREFTSEKELLDAFNAGTVGAVLSELTDVFKGAKKILQLPSVPFSIAVAKSRPDLVRRIDEAVSEILVGEPEFVASLRAQYFRNEADRIVVFNAAEQNWIERQRLMNRAFTVDISPADGFLKIYDDRGATAGGFVGRLFSEVSMQTGLIFRPLKPQVHAQSCAAFEAGQIDIRIPYGCPVCDSGKAADPSRVLAVRIPQAVVTRRFSGVDVSDDHATLAVVETDVGRLSAYERIGVMDRVSVFPSAEDALDAVVHGRVDCFPGDYPLLNRLVRGLFDPLLADIHVNENARYGAELRIYVGPKVDRELVAVLSKVLASFSRDRLVDMENDAEASDSEGGKIGVRRLLRYAGGVLLGVFAVIIAILLYFGMKSRKLLHKSNESLAIAQEAINDAAVARAEMREALDKAEYAAKSKSNFLATMSHEIRTPLNAVIGFSEILAAADVPHDKVGEYARGISLSANALLSLINDILDLSKFESGKTEGLDLRTGVCSVGGLFSEMESVFRMRIERKGLTIAFKGADAFPPLVLSEPRMRQILLNLIGNAAKFTDRGGIVVRAEYRDGLFRLRVVDTGIGISPRGIEHIFDPFAQDMDSRGGKVYAGTGLGLAIVKRLVEASGGTIGVKSIIGTGSAFTVEIPGVRTASPDVLPKTGPSSELKNVLKHVVIADDVAMNRKVLKMHCLKLGFENPLAFDSGFKVIDYLKDPSNPCDIVLTDMWMPGMDGAEVAARCFELRPELPVIAVTADTDAGATFEVTRFKGLLTKPVTLDKLRQLFAKFHA